MRRCELVLPDLELPDARITASLWLVSQGSPVTEGDRVLELLAGEVTIDLSAPASGMLLETLVEEDEQLTVGQVLAVIAVDP